MDRIRLVTCATSLMMSSSPLATDAPIDLRSDTVTRPTEAMRRAMATAEVGDDVYGEDPTVERLQDVGADLLGKPAALFMPTGMMANQVALHLQARPGDEVLIEASGHGHDWELGAAAVLSGLQMRPVLGDAGVLLPSHVEPYLRSRPYYQSRPTMIVLENTHNMAGGRIYPLEVAREVVATCRDEGLRAHLDGARLFNAAVASGRSAAVLAAEFDSVMVSLSKGLSAPAGALLAGGADLIREARRVRKMFGGGMRQIGVLAAPALVALEGGIDRLAEDHANARRLADGLLATGRVALTFGHVDTNIVVFDVDGLSAQSFCDRAVDRRVLCAPTAAGQVRLVIHRHITAPVVDEALARLAPLVDGAS